MTSVDDLVGNCPLLRALTVAYECIVPKLQRILSTLETTASGQVALLIPHTRRVLLEVR
jgi:hypothetical protein